MVMHWKYACTAGMLAFAGMATDVAAELPKGAGDGGVSAFYSFTEQISGGPGKLLRSEPLTGRAALAEAGSSTRVLYSSTDGLDGRSLIAVSGALFIPKGTPPKGGWPLMAWTHGTVGIADVCAPSWAGPGERDIRYLSHWLNRGYAIVATDYQGLGTPGVYPYSAARPEAYSVLDSIRAVQNGDFPIARRVLLFGQSQGGAAAFAAASHAGTYAPELEVVGLVATGTPQPRVDSITAKSDQVSPLLGFVLQFAHGLLATAPRSSPQDYFTDKAMPAFDLARTACFPAVVEKITADRLTYDNSFKRQADDGLAFGKLMEGLMAYPTLKTDFPIFMGVGGKDVTTPPASQARLASAACKAGSRVEWHLYPELDHSGTIFGSLPDSTPFVEKAFAGQPIGGNCGTAH
ncbi:alpha/beta fold hydrolase [Variovorax sp. LT1R20]|uniref:alpha/beta fold hydrolase n=1 Tax=Variovorax sp. LT1R20 TaxID=3443729 RepID=UPI003F480772